MSYKTEFPEFDSIPYLMDTEGYKDESFGHDVCPHFEYALTDACTIFIWFDYQAEHPYREFKDDYQYKTCLYDNTGDWVKSLYCTNDLNKFKEYIESIKGKSSIEADALASIKEA